MGNSIKPHIQNAQKTGVCQLKNNGLTEIPKELFRLSSMLRTLDLSDNKLSNIEPILQFTILKQLLLANNRINKLPDQIVQLNKLENLVLSGNVLTDLPTNLSGLTNLRTVDLSHNRLTSFPVGLLGLRRLELVDLSHNKITALPENMDHFSATELNLSQNQLSSLPSSLAAAPSLKVLRVEENCLPLSAIEASKILEESKVNLFAVDGNLFDPRDFRELPGHEVYMERYTASKKKMY